MPSRLQLFVNRGSGQFELIYFISNLELCFSTPVLEPYLDLGVRYFGVRSKLLAFPSCQITFS